MRYVALLRGINVGGNKKISMADLRALLSSLGHTDVTTYLQSGNALFTSGGDDSDVLRQEIERRITSDLGLDVKVLVRTPEELERVVAGNPFPEAAISPTKLHVCFLSSQPDQARLAAVAPRQFEPDEFRLGERAIYHWYPNGSGRSKLSLDVWERSLGLTATARNWNTVTKILNLATVEVPHTE